MSAGKLGGEVKAGRSIALGMAMLGRTTAQVDKVNRSELTGSGCEGATHFLQRATLGAFAIATGSIGKTALVADVFKIGASASSESSRDASMRDGLLDACRQAPPDSETPTQHCRAPLFAELMPIHGKAKVASTTDPADAAKADAAEPKADSTDAPAPPPASSSSNAAPDRVADAKKETKTADENPCRPGYVFSGGICTKQPTDTGYLCQSFKKDECKEQCEKGNAGSCYNFGWGTDDAEAMPFYKKGCELGHADSCDKWGRIVRPPYGKTSPDDAERYKKAYEIFKTGCKNGSSDACISLAEALDENRNPSMRDLPASFVAWKRGCTLGSSVGCYWTAIGYVEGKGTAKDPQKGLDLLNKACDGGNQKVCEDLVGELRRGSRFPKDLKRSLQLSKNLCATPASDGFAKVAIGSRCEVTAEILTELGQYDEAFKYAKQACEANLPNVSYCMAQAQLQEEGKGTKKDVAAARSIFTKYCGEEMNRIIDSLRDGRQYCKGAGASPAKPGAKPAAKPKPKK
jgi:TPR repeat protein